MTTGRINQVATSSRVLANINKPARCLRRPRRTHLPCPPCPRAGRVFPSAQPIDADQCRKVPLPSPNTSLATGADQQRRFVLPSCCFPRALLSTSSPQSASAARSVERAGPPQVLTERAPSVRGARSFTPNQGWVVAAAFSRDRCEVNAGHCLRTRCFLRRPLPQKQRDDSVIGPGLVMSSPRAACHAKSRALLSRTCALLASRRRRPGKRF